MRRRFYPFLFLLTAPLLARPARAQQPALPAAPTPPSATGFLRGTVLDSLGGKPVPYATVVLLPVAAEKALTGVAADDEGRFTITKIAPGAYRLRVSYVGYSVRTRAVTVAAGGTTEVGSFRLPTAATNLAEAVVVGQKQVVEVKPDRLIYNADQDVTNAGGTAADVLRKAPLLAVDGDDKVTMRGSSNFRVLINNKPSPTLANNLADALKSIPADQIKTVEIITTPPAKYDGEGTAGIINIVLKKGVNRGLNGRVGTGGGNRGTNTNASLNFKKGKIGFSSSGGGGTWNGPSEYRRERTDYFVLRPDNQQPAQLLQTGAGRYGGHYVYGNVGLDYDPAEHHSFSLAGSLQRYAGQNQQDLFNRYNAGSPALNQLFVRDTKSIFSGFTGELTGTYTRTFVKARREWSVLGQASRTNGEFGYDYNQYNGTTTQSEAQAAQREHSLGTTPGHEFTLQTDFTQPFGEKQTLEAGLKSIWRQTGSLADVTRTSQPGGELLPQPARNTDFDYSQNVQAAYATYSLSLSKKLNLSLGARAEHTALDASVRKPVLQPTFTQGYSNFLPNGNAQYAFTEASSLRLAYSKRITRPFIDYLNPFVDRSDSLTIRVGNPRLSPELTDSYELSYNTLVKTATLSVSGSVRRTGNAIESVRLPASQVSLPDNGTPISRAATVETFQNVAANTSYQLNFYGSVKPAKGWDLSGGPNVEYIVRRSPALGITRRGVSASLNFNTSYKLPKDFTVQAFMYGSLPSINLQGSGSGNLYYNLGLKKTFLNKKADLVLNVNSPFNNTWVYRNTLDTPAFSERQENINYQRSFRLSFSYRFGQDQQMKQRKSISNDDVKNGGSKQGGQ